MPTPTESEIKLSDIPHSGNRTKMPESLVASIEAEAAKNAPQDIALPDPPKDPVPPAKMPPVPNGTPKEAPKPTPQPAKAPEPTPAEEPKGIKHVREALERANAKLKEAQDSATSTAKERADLATKVAEMETRMAQHQEREEKEIKPRLERLKEVEDRLQKKEDVLRIKAYTETDEFHEKYVKPLHGAQGEINELLAELVVANDDGSARPATMDDFNEVLAARSLNDAHAIASKKFGPIAPTVVNFRTRIRGLERSRTEAMKEAGLRSAEFEKNQQVAMAQQRENFRNILLTEAERLIGESPELKVDDGDTETRQVKEEATRFADEILEGPRDGTTPEAFVKKIAKARVKMIKHDVLEKKLSKATAKITELEEKLKGYEGSEPALNGRASPASAPAKNGTAHERLLAAAQSAASSVLR